VVVLHDRTLCLPTFSHLLIVNKPPLLDHHTTSTSREAPSLPVGVLSTNTDAQHKTHFIPPTSITHMYAWRCSHCRYCPFPLSSPLLFGSLSCSLHSKHVCLLSASRKNSAGTHTNTKTRHTLAHAHVSMQAHKRRTVPHRQSQTGAHHRRARVISLHVGESWDQSIIMHPAAVEHVHCPPSTLFAVKARDALVRPEGAALIHVHIDLLQVRACRHFDSPCSKTTPHKPTPNTRRNQRDIRDASLLQPSPHARGRRSTAHHPSR